MCVCRCSLVAASVYVSSLSQQLALKHDTARVVQSCIKKGSREHRTLVFSEIKGV